MSNADGEPVVGGGDVLVFVSHATVDTWIAKKLGEGVAQAGAGYFLDVVDVEVLFQRRRGRARLLRQELERA
jgi:hypothetical protein